MAAPEVISPGRRRFAEETLLDAARDVFHAQGYDAAQIADIAEQAGTTKPTLYARLGGKAAIYLRVIEREEDALRTLLADAYEAAIDLPLVAMIQSTTDPFFRFATERRAGYDLLFQSEPGNPGRPAKDRVELDVIGWVARLIEHQEWLFGRRLGASAEALAAACVGVSSRICQHAVDKGQDLGAAADLAAMFIASAAAGLDLPTLERFDEISRKAAQR